MSAPKFPGSHNGVEVLEKDGKYEYCKGQVFLEQALGNQIPEGERPAATQARFAHECTKTSFWFIIKQFSTKICLYFVCMLYESPEKIFS